MPRSAFDRTPQQAGPGNLRARPGRTAEVRGGSGVIPGTRLELSELKHSVAAQNRAPASQTRTILKLIG